MANPIKAVMDIKREELPLSLLMFSYFFLVITSFWVLKPLKSKLFIEFYDQIGFDLFSWHMEAAQAELLAKILNMFVAFIAVVVFTWLVRKFRRQQLTYIFSGFFLASYVGYTFVINNPSDITVWTFYLFGDLFTTLMVATFFAFLNDSVTPDGAKRLYGLIVLGGVLGGAIGATFFRGLIAHLANSSWLWICFFAAILIIIIAMAAGRFVERNPPPEQKEEKTKSIPRNKGNPALEGAKLVFKSPYLLAIVAIVGLYEITSQTLDFQFKATVAYYLDGPDIGKQFATVYAISNITAMIVQLFLTSYVMTRFGLKTALLVLPVMIFLGSTGFLMMPILWAGSLLNTADSGFSYGINQSAKEALYVPTTKDEKYKAKAFIDMFVQRFAKVLAIGVSLAITAYFAEFSSKRWLSLFTIAIVVLWIFAARYAGTKFREMTT
jgi:AAA family ATP:ADP antiporter